MLNQLQITNFTLIDHITLDFTSGFSVLTGETGAGKSILIDALNLTLGSRALGSLVKKPHKRASIIASFNITGNEQANAFLKEYSLDSEGECILRRVLYSEGRSQAFINGHACTLQQIRELAQVLLAIHGQHEHHHLLQRDYQRQLLDAYAENQELVKNVQRCYQQWHQLQQQLTQLSGSEKTHHERKALLQYQLAELDALVLQEKEVTQLHQQHQHLSNAASIKANYEQVLSILSQADNNSIEQLLHQAGQMLPTTPLNETQNVINLLESARIQCLEASDELKQLNDKLSIDSAGLSDIEKRLEAIHDIARKHHVEAEQLFSHWQSLQQQFQTLLDNEDKITQLTEDITAQEKHYQKLARQLHGKRIIAAKRLQTTVTKTLKSLGMANAKFTIHVSIGETMNSHGYDQIEFLIQTNPDAETAPLAKIASGGELSRISLAIDVVSAKVQQLSTIIFDEIDTGIGGNIANTVAELLRQLGNHTQVLSITHLPQVAARASHHIHVSKAVKDHKTQIQAIALNEQQRIIEIARMLSGDKFSEQSIRHAEEMLAFNGELLVD